MSPSQPLHRLADHLPLVERIVGSLRARKSLSADEAEDFRSWLHLRLVEGEARIFGSFEGRSRFSTYLAAVIHNLFRDYRIAKWGKWRPSAAARRLGAVAQRLEEILERDRVPFEEAAEILRRNHGVRLTVREIAELAGRLPQRERPRFEGVESAEELPDPEPGVQPPAPSRDVTDRFNDDFRAATRALGIEDRMILKLWAFDGFGVAEVARALALEQKPLYRRLEALQRQLRSSLETEGWTWDQVAELLGSMELESCFAFGSGGETAIDGPSNVEGRQ